MPPTAAPVDRARPDGTGRPPAGRTLRSPNRRVHPVRRRRVPGLAGMLLRTVCFGGERVPFRSARGGHPPSGGRTTGWASWSEGPAPTASGRPGWPGERPAGPRSSGPAPSPIAVQLSRPTDDDGRASRPPPVRTPGTQPYETAHPAPDSGRPPPGATAGCRGGPGEPPRRQTRAPERPSPGLAERRQARTTAAAASGFPIREAPPGRPASRGGPVRRLPGQSCVPCGPGAPSRARRLAPVAGPEGRPRAVRPTGAAGQRRGAPIPRASAPMAVAGTRSSPPLRRSSRSSRSTQTPVGVQRPRLTSCSWAGRVAAPRPAMWIRAVRIRPATRHLSPHR